MRLQMMLGETAPTARRLTRLALGLLTVVVGLALCQTVALAADPVVTFDPVTSTHTVGETFAVDVVIQGVTDLGAVDVQIGWDPNYVTIVDAGAGTNIEILPGDIFPGDAPILNDADDAAGTIYYAVYGSTPFTGDGVIATITMTAVGDGLLLLPFDGCTLLDSGYGDMAKTTVAGQVTILPAGPTETPTATATQTLTPTATATMTLTPTATATATETVTPTATTEATATETATATATETVAATATVTETPGATATWTVAPRFTYTPTPEASNTPGVTNTPGAGQVVLPLVLKQPYVAPEPTATWTVTPTPDGTSVPEPTPTDSPVTATATETLEPAATETATPAETATSTLTVAPSETATSTLTPSITPTPSDTPTPTQTLTPSITPTPSDTPTPTPTFTVAPTPTSTPTLGPGACLDLIVNGDAESQAGWEFPVGLPTGGYTTFNAHGGTRSLRTGIEIGVPYYGYSQAEQWIDIPANAESMTLTLWYFSQSLGGFEDTTDRNYVMIIAEDGTYKPLLELAYPEINLQVWTELTFDETDLAEFVGQRVSVHVRTFNNSWGNATTFYVDDVSFEVCDD